MMFFILSVLAGTFLIAFILFFGIKKWKAESSIYKRTNIELGFGFLLLMAIVTVIMFFVFFGLVCSSIFNQKHPVCIEYVGSIPIDSHWTTPNKKTVSIPEGFPNFSLRNTDNPRSYYDRNLFLSDGLRISAFHKNYVLIENGNIPKDSLRFYVYKYEKWGPFSCPSFMREGHACIGEPDLIVRGQCKTKAKVKE